MDVTHPPTPYRIAFLQSREALQLRVVLPAAESDRIDQELATLHPRMRRQILDAYRRRLEVAYY